MSWAKVYLQTMLDLCLGLQSKSKPMLSKKIADQFSEIKEPEFRSSENHNVYEMQKIFWCKSCDIEPSLLVYTNQSGPVCAHCFSSVSHRMFISRNNSKNQNALAIALTLPR